MLSKILLIDDDEEMCDELSEILMEENYDVNVAYDGLKAKELVETNKYDLLLLDLKLPFLSGFDIIKFIRDKKLKTKIIILTSRPIKLKIYNPLAANEVKHEEDLLSFANKVINKPFNLPLVLEEINNVLRKDHH